MTDCHRFLPCRGSSACVSLYRDGTILQIYRAARQRLSRRPWAIDEFDQFSSHVLRCIDSNTGEVCAEGSIETALCTSVPYPSCCQTWNQVPLWKAFVAHVCVSKGFCCCFLRVVDRSGGADKRVQMLMIESRLFRRQRMEAWAASSCLIVSIVQGLMGR